MTAGESTARDVAKRNLPGLVAGLWDVKRRPLRQLEAVWLIRSVLDRIEGEWIDAALDRGASYGDVGRALRVSRQAVRQRVERSRRLEDPVWAFLDQARVDARERERLRIMRKRGHAA